MLSLLIYSEHFSDILLRKPNQTKPSALAENTHLWGRKADFFRREGLRELLTGAGWARVPAVMAAGSLGWWLCTHQIPTSECPRASEDQDRSAAGYPEGPPVSICGRGHPQGPAEAVAKDLSRVLPGGHWDDFLSRKPSDTAWLTRKMFPK